MNWYALSLVAALAFVSRSALAVDERQAIDLGSIAGHSCGNSDDEEIEDTGCRGTACSGSRAR